MPQTFNLGSINVSFGANIGAGVRALQVANAQVLTVAQSVRTATTSFAQSIDTLNVALGSVGLSNLVKQAESYDRAMVSIRAVSKVTEEQFVATRRRILELSKDLGVPADEAARAFNEIVQAGFGIEESFDIVTASLKGARAGLTDTKVAATALIQTLQAFRIPAGESSDVMGRLVKAVDIGVFSFERLASNVGQVAPLASVLGLKLNELLGLMTSLTRTEANLDEVTTQIRATFTDLIAPSKAAGEQMEKVLGTSVEASLRVQGFAKTLDILVGSANGSSVALAKMFPNIRAVSAVAKIASAGIGEFNKDVEILNSTGVVNLNRTLEITSTSFATLADRIRATIANAFFEWFENNRVAIINATRALDDFLRKHGELLVTLSAVAVGVTAFTVTMGALKIAASGAATAVTLLIAGQKTLSAVLSGSGFSQATAVLNSYTGALAGVAPLTTAATTATTANTAAVNANTAANTANAVSFNARLTALSSLLPISVRAAGLSDILTASVQRLATANAAEKLAVAEATTTSRAKALALAAEARAVTALATAEARRKALDSQVRSNRLRGITDVALENRYTKSVVEVGDRTAKLAAANAKVAATTTAATVASYNLAAAWKESTDAAGVAAKAQQSLSGSFLNLKGSLAQFFPTFAKFPAALRSMPTTISGVVTALKRLSIAGSLASGLSLVKTGISGIGSALVGAIGPLGILVAKLAAVAAVAVASFWVGTKIGRWLFSTKTAAIDAQQALEDLNKELDGLASRLAGAAKNTRFDQNKSDVEEYRAKLVELAETAEKAAKGNAEAAARVPELVAGLSKLGGEDAIAKLTADYEDFLATVKRGDLTIKDQQADAIRKTAAYEGASKEEQERLTKSVYDANPFIKNKKGGLQTDDITLAKQLKAADPSLKDDEIVKRIAKFREAEKALIGVKEAQSDATASLIEFNKQSTKVNIAVGEAGDALNRYTDDVEKAADEVAAFGQSESEKAIAVLDNKIEELTGIYTILQNRFRAFGQSGLPTDAAGEAVRNALGDAYVKAEGVLRAFQARRKKLEAEGEAEKKKIADDAAAEAEDLLIDLLRKTEQFYQADTRAAAAAYAKKKAAIEANTKIDDNAKKLLLSRARALYNAELADAKKADDARFAASEEGRRLIEEQTAAYERLADEQKAEELRAKIARAAQIADATTELALRQELVAVLKKIGDQTKANLELDKAKNAVAAETTELLRQQIEDLARAGKSNREITEAVRGTQRSVSGGSNVNDYRSGVRDKFKDRDTTDGVKGLSVESKKLLEVEARSLSKEREEARKKGDRTRVKEIDTELRDVGIKYQILLEETKRSLTEIAKAANTANANAPAGTPGSTQQGPVAPPSDELARRLAEEDARKAAEEKRKAAPTPGPGEVGSDQQGPVLDTGFGPVEGGVNALGEASRSILDTLTGLSGSVSDAVAATQSTLETMTGKIAEIAGVVNTHTAWMAEQQVSVQNILIDQP